MTRRRSSAVVLFRQAGPRCPVCSHGLATMVTLCVKCNALLHPECYAYQGGCGVYGCSNSGAGKLAKIPKPTGDDIPLWPLGLLQTFTALAMVLAMFAVLLPYFPR